MSSNKRYHELVAVNRAITSTLDYKEVLRLVVDKATEFTGADACALLLSKGEDRVRVAASRGIGQDKADKVDMPLDEGVGSALRQMLGFGEDHNFLGAPVMYRGRIEGLLVVYRQSPAIPDVDEEFLLGALADQAAIALEHARRFEEMTRISKHQQRLLETIHANTTTALAYLDDDLCFVEANAAYCSIVGLDRDQLLGRPHGEVFDDPEVAAVLHKVRNRGELGELKEVAVAARGESEDRQMWLDWDARPIRRADGSVEAMVLSALDVTDAVHSRWALEAEASRKDEFLAMLAHELRNPLAAINAAVEVLRGPDTLGKELLSRAQGVASRQIAHMARLLDDLLDVSRITYGKITLELEILDLKEVVEQAVESTMPIASASGHKVSAFFPEESVLVAGDAHRLVQVVSNLLANAAKYSQAAGHTEILVRRAGDTAEVHVRDDGVGIQSDVLAQVFDLFVQSARPLAREHGGLGIGLTVVKRLIEMHNGTVEASSEGRGHGSQFVIRLPAVEGSPKKLAQAVAATTQASAQAGWRVLLVEDNADAAEMLSTLLKFLGHEVMHAGDGLAALKVAHEWNPEVVLLDIGLPAMDGYEVARRMRSELPAPGPRLIALSGYGQKEDRDKAHAAGMDDYLVKPAGLSKLRQALRD